MADEQQQFLETIQDAQATPEEIEIIEQRAETHGLNLFRSPPGGSRGTAPAFPPYRNFTPVEQGDGNLDWDELLKIAGGEDRTSDAVQRVENAQNLSRVFGTDPAQTYDNHDVIAEYLSGKPTPPVAFGSRIRAYMRATDLQIQEADIWGDVVMRGWVSGDVEITQEEQARLDQIKMSMPDPSLLEHNGILEHFQKAVSQQALRSVRQYQAAFGDWALPVTAASMVAGLAATYFAGPAGGTAVQRIVQGGSTMVASGGRIMTLGRTAMMLSAKTFAGSMLIGASLEGGKQEMGIAMAELMSLTDEQGNPIDPQIALRYATLYGAIATALESVGVSSGAKLVPGLRNLLSEGGQSFLLKGGARQIIGRNLARYGVNALIQGGEEMSQALAQGLLREAAIAEYNKRTDGAGNRAFDRFQRAITASENLLVYDEEMRPEALRQIAEDSGMLEAEEEIGKILHEWETIFPNMIEEASAAVLASLGLGGGSTVINVATDVASQRSNQEVRNPYAGISEEMAMADVEYEREVYEDNTDVEYQRESYEDNTDVEYSREPSSDGNISTGRRTQFETQQEITAIKTYEQDVQRARRISSPVQNPQAVSEIGVLIEGMSQKRRQEFLARERNRIRVTPAAVIENSTELQNIIRDLELFDSEGKMIEGDKATGSVVVLSNSANQIGGITDNAVLSTNPEALVAKYDISIETAEKVADDLVAFAQQNQTNVQRTTNFTNFDQVKNQINARLEQTKLTDEQKKSGNKEPPVHVHMEWQTFEEYAADRIGSKPLAELQADWQASLENFAELRDVFEKNKRVAFSVDASRQYFSDYRVALRTMTGTGLKSEARRMLNKKKKDGSRGTKIDGQAFADMMKQDVRVIEQNQTIRGDIVEDFSQLIQENPDFSEKNPRTYQVTNKARQKITPELETQIAARAHVKRMHKEAVMRAKRRSPLQQADIYQEFIAAANEIFDNMWAGIDEWSNIGHVRRLQMEERLDNFVIEHYGQDGKIDAKTREERRNFWNLAMLVYRDSEGRWGELWQHYHDNFSNEQIQVFEAARRLPQQLVEIVRQADEFFASHVDDAIDAGIITELRDNYVTVLWEQEDSDMLPTKTQLFRPETERNRQRTYDSIAQGWFAGEKLAVEGITNTYETYARQVEGAIAQKRFVDKGRQILNVDGTPLLTTNPHTRGYVKIGLPGFESKDLVGEYEGQETNEHQVVEDGKIYEYRQLYAPQSIADLLNDSFGDETISTRGWAKLAARWTNLRKKIKLLSNFFHPLAYFRSYQIGTNGKTLEQTLHPVREMRAMLKALRGEHVDLLQNRPVPEQLREIARDGNAATQEILRLGYRAGLTFNLRKDFFTLQQTELTWLGRTTEKYGASKRAKDAVLFLGRFMQHLTFDKIGPGLKAASFVAEMNHAMKHDPTTDPYVHAQRIAKLINDDYGGLNLRREGRSQNHQFIFKLAALAPDWTESNVRTMARMVDGVIGNKTVDDETRALYRRFWKRAGMKVIFGNIMANLMVGTIGWIAGNEEDDPFAQLLDNWRDILDNIEDSDDYPEKIMDFMHFLEVDLSPLWDPAEDMKINDGWFGKGEREGVFNLRSGEVKYTNIIGGHFNDFAKFIAAPIRSARGKSSMVVQDVLSLMEGTDWKGYDFKTFKELRESNLEWGEWLDMENYVTWGSGVGTQPRLINGTAFTFAMYSILNSLPVQMDQWLAFNAGRTDFMTAFLTSIGIGIHSMRKYDARGQTF